ncbi:ankyrin repeat-containing domain protein [Cryomyces antarcticus]
MDPLSIAASVTALLGLANQIVSYANDVREADEARQQLRGEMDRLRSVLLRVEDRMTEAIEEANRGETWNRGLGQVAGLITLLQTAMEKLRDELRPEEGVKKLVKKLRYSWDKPKFSEMLQNIQRYYVATGLVVQHDHLDLSVETSRQLKKLGVEITGTQVHVSRIENTGEDTNYRIKQVEANGIETKSDGKEVKANLERLLLEQQDRDEKQRMRDEEQKFRDEKQRERDEKQQRLEEEAERKAVEDWLSPSQGLTSFQTVLSSIVANHLQKQFDPLQNPVICIFLDVKDPKTQVKDNLFGGLLKQLIQLKGPGPISEDLLQAYQNWKETGVKLALSALRDLLLEGVALFDRVFLLVDALDECTEEFRNWLEDELEEYRPDNMSIFITSRPFGEQKLGEVGCRVCKERPLRIYWHCDNCVDDEDFDICQGCRDKEVTCGHEGHELTEPYPHIEVEVLTPPEELSEYVKFEVRKEIGHEGRRDRRSHPRRRSTRFGARLLNNPKLEEDISTSIVERAEGNFIFAKLYMDALKVQQTTEDIEEALSAFPRSLTTLYEKSMEQRILVQDNEKDKETAMRTLSLLCCAQQTLTLAELQQALATKKGDTKFHWGRDYSKDDILHVTKGLVNIDSSSDPSVRLFHLTFATYLDETRERWFPNGESDLAFACLTYLSFDPFSEPCERSSDFEAKRKQYPFVGYASQHWGDHVRAATSNPEVQEAAARFVQDPSRIAACMQAAWCTQNQGSTGLDFPERVVGLHLCAWFGLSAVLSAMQDKNLDVDARESLYKQTPLMYACKRGQVEIVRQLLARGAGINKEDGKGRTPMFTALECDQTEVVIEILKDPHLKINAVHRKAFNRTAVMLACQSAQLEIAKALLKHQSIDINMQDTEGYTALSLAVTVSCSEIVAELLSHPGIRVDLVENSVGRSALALAAERGSTTIAEMLLQHKADPELRDNKSGGTPIFNAVEWGNLNVVETMLTYDVDPFCEDDDGRTLLHAASVKGDVNILHVLKAKGLSIDSPDKYGFTPLHDASRKGEFEAAEFLLESGADPVRKDDFGRRKRAVMVPVDVEDLPLWSQVNLNRADLVASAVDHQKDKVPVTEPGTGETALHWAVRDNQIEILRMLLDSNLVSVNCANRHNRTPLHLAAACGHLEAAMILLEHGVKVDHVDQWHATALAIAQSNKNFDIAVSLVEANATVDVKRVDIQKLFFAAIELQSATAVEKLLARGADALAKNEEGKTAMDLAKDAGDDDVTHLVAWSKTFYRDEASLAQRQGREMRPLSLRTGSAPFPMPDDV